MEAKASTASSCYEDQAPEEFYFEVPITNLNNKKSAADVLYVNNNANTETSTMLTNTEFIVIDEGDSQNYAKTEDSTENCISITIDDEETDKIVKGIDIKIAALDEGINNEIINNNPMSVKEKDIIIDLNNDNVTVCRTDSDVIILDENKTDSETTIILNDDEINDFTKDNDEHNVIDVEKDTDCCIVENCVNIDSGTKYGVLTELIHKCLGMKNSEGMPRVINRTLLVLYKDVDEGYKKSDEFRKFISDTITLLNVEPERKFSHIKNLCDNMKRHKTKKRVPFITLDKDKEQSSSIPNKRKKMDIIDLDDDTNDTHSNENIENSRNIHPIAKVFPSINLTSSDEDDTFQEGEVIIFNKENRETENIKAFKNTRTVKNNRTIKNTTKHKKLRNMEAKAEKRALKQAKKNSKNKLANNNIPQNSLSDPGMLLEPRMSVGVEIAESNQAKINTIEGNISVLKYQLEMLEEAEVLTDTTTSPYIACERIKTKILQLYRQLCQLTGSEVTKRHEVRLQVVPGHPEGPVRCLEEFLNENIDEEGNPPFPDMADVLDCVLKANTKYNLCWNSPQILNEAQALFTQFGQSMQKRRQMREWKDLMSLVKQEVTDPADEDPALLARLEENKRIAKRNELDLLDKYAKMEHGIYATSDPGLRLRVNESEESDEDTDTSYPEDNTDLQNIITDIGPTEQVDVNYATTNDMLDRIKITKVTSNGVMSMANKIDGNIQHGSTRTDVVPTEQVDVNYATTNDMVDRIKITKVTSNGVMSMANKIDGILKYACTTSAVVPTKKVDVKVYAITNEDNMIDRTRFTKVSSRGVMSLANKIDSNIKHGSTVSVCDGNIVKEPTIQKASDACIQNSDVNTPFVSEYKRFLDTRRKPPPKAISKQNPFISTIFFNHATTPQSNQSTDLSIDKPDHVNNVISFNPTIRLTRLNVKDFRNKTNIFGDSALKTSDNSDPGCVNSEILTHKEDTNKDITLYNALIKNSQNIGSNVIENENETKVEDLETIVKPEPLDIPTMLQELGEGYTATIFDIEDPFLVIEISDTSESEDEND